MPLPAPAWLSLLEAVQFVIKPTGESKNRVHEVLTGAGLMGAITATGCRHLSTCKDSAMYFAHLALDERETVPPETWGTTISWLESRIGRYDLVRLNRADIERWLAAAATNGEEQPREKSPSLRPKKRNKQTQVDGIAEWLREHYPNRPPMRVEELMQVVGQEARHIGVFSKRTFEAALSKAYSLSAIRKEPQCGSMQKT
jgi:hypothetical protein